MNVNCTYCDKEIYKKPSQIKRNKNNFCSVGCKDEWQTGRKYPGRQNRHKHSCHYCNKEIEVPNHKYQKYLSGRFKDLFCNRICQSKWQSENWQGENHHKYSKVEKNCKFCGIAYKVVKSEKETSKYCSKECRTNGRVEDIYLTCDYCEADFTKKKSSIRDNNFCSRECSIKWNSEFNNFQIKKSCLICTKEFKVSRNRADTAKTCSKDCHYKWLSEYYAKSDDGKKQLTSNAINGYLNQKISETKPERIFKEYLIHNNIRYIPQHLMYDKFVVDFYLPNENTIVEVFGDYWHANPLFYGDSEERKPLNARQVKQKKKDKARQAYLEKCGHEFHILWENDIYKNLEVVTEFLSNKK